MRLNNLHLVRFGKFTDTDISLPKAEHDFHLVIGHNEAGKSTMRGAIADLLFGLPFIADDLFINFDDERSTAGLEALRDLSRHTQVLFLSHHDHLLPRVRQVFGSEVNVVELQR